MYRRVAGGGTYLDAFAGTGEVSIGGASRPGSAGVALKSKAFRRYRLYERPEQARNLEHYISLNCGPITSMRIKVIPGDCNEMIKTDLANEVISRDKPCFAFLDPDSTQLDWDTVEALAKYKTWSPEKRQCRVELFVLLNTHPALPRARETNPEVLDRIMGGREAWSDLRDRGEGPSMYAHRYAERLHEELGYGAVVPILISDPATRRPQYYMIHASDHQAAHGFMSWARRATEESTGGRAPIFTTATPAVQKLRRQK